MRIKKALRELQPTISEQLPIGAIAQIAAEMNITRQSVTRMLAGRFGNEETLIRMLNIVANIAEKEGEKQQNLSQLISTLVTDKANVTAG